MRSQISSQGMSESPIQYGWCPYTKKTTEEKETQGDDWLDIKERDSDKSLLLYLTLLHTDFRLAASKAKANYFCGLNHSSEI